MSNEKTRAKFSPVDMLVRLFRGKWKFINYRKEFNGQYPINGLFPEFTKYWRGDIWQLTWRGYAISVDMRTNWLADMVNQNRPNRHKA